MVLHTAPLSVVVGPYNFSRTPTSFLRYGGGMSIHPRSTKNGMVFDVRWKDSGRQRSRSFPDRAQAESYDAEKKRHKRMGAFAPTEPSIEPLSNFLVRWFRTGQWANTTRTGRAQLMDKWIVPYIGDVPLRELGRARVREFRADIVRDGSPPTNTNNVMRCLSAAMSVAADEGLIPMNPCLRLGTVPSSPPQRRAYPLVVTRTIEFFMPTLRDRAVFHLLRTAGLRPAEVVGLQWKDVEDDVLTIYDSIQSGEAVSTKTKMFRAVPIEGELAVALACLPRFDDNDFVVPGDRGGPLNWKMWTRRVWGPAKRATHTDAVPYDMRHSRASELIIDRGMDVASAAAIMGHGPKVMLDHYVHLFQKAHARGGRTGRQARAS